MRSNSQGHILYTSARNNLSLYGAAPMCTPCSGSTVSSNVTHAATPAEHMLYGAHAVGKAAYTRLCSILPAVTWTAFAELMEAERELSSLC